VINLVLVGAGKWAIECWAPLLTEFSGEFTVRAVVDPHPGRALTATRALHLPDRSAYADLSTALADQPEISAGVVVASPEEHAGSILALAQRGIHVLTEKPLVTTLQDAQRMAAVLPTTGVKLAVMQNYRYQARIQALRQAASTFDLGPLHYAVARFAADYRVPGSWDVGDAHTMDHPLLVEGAIHHLDMIRYLTGRDVQAVSAVATNPPGSSFTGDCVAGLLLHLTGGAFALYEATLQAAGTQNRWRNEYYRLEFASGALACDTNQVTLTRDGNSEPVPARADPDMFAGHRRVLSAFAAWLNGGPPVETTLTDNLRSLAIVFAAIEAANGGATVTVTPPQPQAVQQTPIASHTSVPVGSPPVRTGSGRPLN
jgi:predicted dehydrogenase